jgi:hypothetical protein
MNPFDALFLHHPRAVGETYGEHFGVASTVGARMIAAGAACSLHAFVPAVFATTASRTIIDLHSRLKTRNRPEGAAEIEGPDFYYL